MVSPTAPCAHHLPTGRGVAVGLHGGLFVLNLSVKGTDIRGFDRRTNEGLYTCSAYTHKTYEVE